MQDSMWCLFLGIAPWHHGMNWIWMIWYYGQCWIYGQIRRLKDNCTHRSLMGNATCYCRTLHFCRFCGFGFISFHSFLLTTVCNGSFHWLQRVRHQLLPEYIVRLSLWNLYLDAKTISARIPLTSVFVEVGMIRIAWWQGLRLTRLCVWDFVENNSVDFWVCIAQVHGQPMDFKQIQRHYCGRLDPRQTLIFVLKTGKNITWRQVHGICQ